MPLSLSLSLSLSLWLFLFLSAFFKFICQIPDIIPNEHRLRIYRYYYVFLKRLTRRFMEFHTGKRINSNKHSAGARARADFRATKR